MTPDDAGDGVGCRSAVLAGGGLLSGALVVGGIGLALVREGGLWLFYAAAPMSAVFGVIGGGLPVAWPLDAGLWLVVGLGAASWSGRIGRPLWTVVAGVAVVALAYGWMMSRLVEVF